MRGHRTTRTPIPFVQGDSLSFTTSEMTTFTHGRIGRNMIFMSACLCVLSEHDMCVRGQLMSACTSFGVQKLHLPLRIHSYIQQLGDTRRMRSDAQYDSSWPRGNKRRRLIIELHPRRFDIYARWTTKNFFSPARAVDGELRSTSKR